MKKFTLRVGDLFFRGLQTVARIERRDLAPTLEHLLVAVTPVAVEESEKRLAQITCQNLNYGKVGESQITLMVSDNKTVQAIMNLREPYGKGATAVVRELLGATIEAYLQRPNLHSTAVPTLEGLREQLRSEFSKRWQGR